MPDGDKKPKMGRELKRLWKTIEARKDADPESSYTAQLLSNGTHKPAKKLGEEGVEAALAAAVGDREELTKEAADLLYHLYVALAVVGVHPNDVAAELARRTGQSGLEEKASRKKD